MAAAEVYIATETGVTAPINGVEYSFQKGVTTVRAGHPLLKACPKYFEPEVNRVTYDVEAATAAPKVEAATAAPGELRTVSHP